MLANNQLRVAIGFAREMRRRTLRKAGDPVAASDRRMFMQMKKRNVLAKSEMSDGRVRLHDQLLGKNPRDSDTTARVQLVTKLLFEN